MFMLMLHCELNVYICWLINKYFLSMSLVPQVTCEIEIFYFLKIYIKFIPILNHEIHHSEPKEKKI